MKQLIPIIFLIQFFICGCGTQQEFKKEIQYIIQHPNFKSTAVLISENGDTTYIPSPPPPPPAYYGTHNFILIGSDQVFFHNRNGPWYWCGTGVDYDKPEKLNLVPANFQQIKLSNLKSFLIDSVSNSEMNDGRKPFVKIAAPQDTIYNPGIKIILKHLKEIELRRFVIRNSTEEENCVINSIIEKKPFDPNTCDYKIGFGGIRFNPPVKSDSIK